MGNVRKNLLPERDAAQFLSSYKNLLQTVAGQKIENLEEYAKARSKFFSSKRLLAIPPTNDSELLSALKTAQFAPFIVCCHLERYTVIMGTDQSVHKIKGITTQLSEIIEPWSYVQTAIMLFRGNWIYDGILLKQNIAIGKEIRKEIITRIRNA